MTFFGTLAKAASSEKQTKKESIRSKTNVRNTFIGEIYMSTENFNVPYLNPINGLKERAFLSKY